MILKINNMLDTMLFKNEFASLPVYLQETVNERLKTLEEAYETPFLDSPYGSVSIYIITEKVSDRNNIVDMILKFYNIDPTEESYEYVQDVDGSLYNKEEIPYKEILYLLGNGEKSILIFCAK